MPTSTGDMKMFDRKDVGYVYKHKSGMYLTRHLRTGVLDVRHYAIALVEKIEDATLFEELICEENTPFKYRTICATDTIAECTPIKVEKHTVYMKGSTVTVLED